MTASPTVIFGALLQSRASDTNKTQIPQFHSNITLRSLRLSTAVVLNIQLLITFYIPAHLRGDDGCGSATYLIGKALY